MSAWKTLNEISEDYEASADLLRDRLHDLRAKLAETENPEEQWHLKRRISVLTPMLTEMNDLANLTGHYYRHGGEFDDYYGFNTTRRRGESGRAENALRSEKEKDDEAPRHHCRKRADRPSKADLEALQHIWDEYNGNS